jgi:hypothetical protein
MTKDNGDTDVNNPAGGSMLISRRALIAAFGLAPTAILLPREAFAAYPDRPIRLIVPFAAAADIVEPHRRADLERWPAGRRR